MTMVSVFLPIVGCLISIVITSRSVPLCHILKQYLVLDSFWPISIGAAIAFYSMITFTGINYWFQYWMVASFPILVIYMTGYLRVAVYFFQWPKWKIIVYKIMLTSCGMVFFYIGFRFLRGQYKVTRGMMV